MSESLLPELEAPRNRRHQEAIEAAARAAQARGFSDDVFRDSVLGVRDDVDEYSRALHIVEMRKVRLHTEPNRARPKEQSAIPSPEHVDPWTVDIQRLATDSRVAAWCPTCLGSGATKCASCRGVGRLKCPRCDGAGSTAQGECPQCAGTKRVPCGTCDGGQTECGECKGAGQVTAWLDVERSTRQIVCVHPMGAAARAHPGVMEAPDFDVEPARWPAPLVEDTGPRGANDLPRPLLPTSLKTDERVVSSRVQRFQSVRTLVTYATAVATGVVPVGGTPPEVDPTADWRPFELRRATGAVLALVIVGGATLLAWAWVTRHPWYAQAGHADVFVAVACAAAVAVAVTVAGMLLTGAARTPMRVWVPAGMAMLLVGAMALVLRADRPRRAHAEAAFARGDLRAARVEADALRSLDIDRAAGEALLDRVHLRETQAPGRTLDARVAEVRARWYTPALAAEARRAVTTALEQRAAEASRDAAELTRLAELARELSPPLRERLLRDAAMLRARVCAEAGDGRCTRDETTHALEHGADPGDVAPMLQRVRERAQQRFHEAATAAEGAHEPRDRVEKLRAAVEASEGLTLLTQEPTAPTVDVLRERLLRAEADAAPREEHHDDSDDDTPEGNRHHRRRRHDRVSGR